MADNGKGPIQAQFSSADSDRQDILDRARLCAALTKPWALPPQHQHPDEKLPENFQALGSRGVTNLEGKMLMALYPPEQPWFQLEPAPEILHGEDIPGAELNAIRLELMKREIIIQASLESANLKTESQRRVSGFRSHQRRALSQILITGETLEKLGDDLRMRLFRRDNYITQRDTAGDVLYHITREQIDPYTLTDEQIQAAKIKQEQLEKPAHERMVDIYTLVEWQPRGKTWRIEQEVNGHSIAESEERVSPYFSTPFELAPGENYGRGFVELNLGDLRTHNELREKLIDFAAIHSKLLIALDHASQTRESDLAKPSGSVIRARVSAGQIQDAALFEPGTGVNFDVVRATNAEVASGLGAAMLLESAVQPEGERVTATQIRQLAQELEGALGGVYAPIAESKQVPLLRRATHVLERENVLTTVDEKLIRIRALTGIAALGREIDASKLLSVAQIASQLPPGAQSKIDYGVLLDVLLRYRGVHEPGLIKSNEQVAQEQQAAAQAQLQQQIGEKAINVVGNAAEAQLTADPNAPGD